MIAKRIKKVGKLRIYTETDDRGRNFRKVFVDYVPVAYFNIGNINERKMAVIDLVEQGHCNQKEAGIICDFHRNTIFKILRVKNLLGIEAVFEDKRGPNGPSKYIGKVRSHIKKLIRTHPDWIDQKIADKASKELSMDVSRNAVARIRFEKEGQNNLNRKKSKAELLLDAHLVDALDKRNFEKTQLELDLIWDQEIKEATERCSAEDPVETKSHSQKSLVDRLSCGEHFNFAGQLIHNCFLNKIGLDEISSIYPVKSGNVYQNQDILSTIFHSINLGVPSIEGLKLINPSDMGLLIGHSRGPDKNTIRRQLAQMGDLDQSDTLIDNIAQILLEQNFIDREVFFIDGHFLPYYGLKVIAKGYYTVRRLAMKGNELYTITDLQGRPLFFITESNEIDFRPIISRSAKKLKAYGIERPILVFDRGGYGIHFFTQLDKDADFISWAKYVSDKALNSIPDTDFTVGLSFSDHKYEVAEQPRTVKESAQTAKKEGRSEPAAIDLRMVVLKNVDTGKRIAIYTNNKTKPSHDIAFYMLNRWGKSENNFKELMARFNLNYHPGYDISELENQPLVNNPDIPLIKQAIRRLKKEITGCKNEILILEAKETKRRDIRRQKKIADCIDKIEDYQKEIAGFDKKLSELPDKISIIDILHGKVMSRCDLEKKKLYDAMQFMAYNSREHLVEIFRNCYNDKRDVKQVLDRITSSPGNIKLYGKTLFVILDWIENNIHRESAIKLCQKLNKMDIQMAGDLNLKLAFYISKHPKHSLKKSSCTN